MRKPGEDLKPARSSPRSLGRGSQQACAGNDLRLSDPRETVQVNGVDVGKRRFIDFVDGTNVTITGTDFPDDDKVQVEITSTGGAGGGAPETAEYVVAASDAALVNARVLTNTPTIEWDVGTAAQMKAAIPTGAVTTTQLGGDVTTAGKALLTGADSAAQRTSLGLGTSATLDVGVGVGKVAAGDDGRLEDRRSADAIYDGTSDYPITSIADGEYLRLSGGFIVGGTPTGGSGDDTVFADSPNQSIAMSTTYEDLCSKSLTVAVGDRIIVEVYGTIFNNTAATQTYRWQVAIGATELELIDGTTIASSATNHTAFSVKGVIAVSSTTNTRLTMESIRGGPTLANTSSSTSGSTIRMSWASSGSDLTGVKTVEMRMRSATSTANQNAIVHSWSISQTPQRT